MCRDKLDALHLNATSRLAIDKFLIVPRSEVDEVKLQYRNLLERASHGDGAAMVTIGSWYQGQGRNLSVPRDDRKALEWYEKGVEAGNPYAMSKLGECYQYGIGVTADVLRAVALYRKADCKNGSHGTYKLAECYEKGIGVGKNEKEALRLYLKASSVPGMPAFTERSLYYRLGRCYENGIGIDKDVKEARWWYGKAAKMGCELSRGRVDVIESKLKDERVERKRKLEETLIKAQKFLDNCGGSTNANDRILGHAR